MDIPFGNLQRHYRAYRTELHAAVNSVLESGWFVLGHEGEKFERAFAEYCGVEHAVGVGSGTEAIQLALMAAGIRQHDEVITVANTCVPTVAGIVSAGAKPVLTDIDERSFTMSPESLEKNVSPRTRAIIPVHLYGQSADLVPIYEIAQRYGLIVIEDAAQAHGTKYHHKKIGSIALLTAFSFYPSKNLGCFGDGGCVTTNDPALASKLRMLRNYGQRQRYYHSVYGINSRLDEIQAAVLSAKLPHLDAWNERRRQIATLYDRLIQNPYVAKPLEMHYGFHVWHLYVLRVRGRSQFQDYLKTRGIGTMIHYPVPIHLQDAYKYLGYAKGAFPITERVSEEIVSIPIYPELTDAEVKYISDAINSFQPQA